MSYVDEFEKQVVSVALWVVVYCAILSAIFTLFDTRDALVATLIAGVAGYWLRWAKSHVTIEPRQPGEAP